MAVLLFALLLIPQSWLNDQSGNALAVHALVGALGLLLFGLFYLLSWMAGGDVKLAAAVLSWAGPEHAAATLMAIAVSGIALAVAQLLAKRYVTPVSVWHASRGTPYGVALAAGGMWAIWRPVVGEGVLF